MNKRFTLWASNWTDNYDTDKFSIGRACFLSSAPNSHELTISPEVLKQCASSILGCFLVADVDTDAYGNKDFTTHVPQEKIIGYAPVEQSIEFESDDDGIIRAYATFVISKMYAGEEVSIFDETGNLQNVSVEMMVTTDETDPNVVTEFDIFGLTVLGKDVNGSCPSACMSITRFSVEEAIEAFKNKEVIKMQEDEKKLAEETEVEAAETEVDAACPSEEEEAKCAEPEKEECAEPEEAECAEPEEEDMSCKEESEEDMSCASEKDEEDMSCPCDSEEEDMSAEVARLNQQIADMAAQIENNNNVIMEQERELAELRAFRDKAQQEELATNVEAVLSEVSSAFGEEQLAEYRQAGITGGADTFSAWANQVKAEAFSAINNQKKAKPVETLWSGMLRMSAPVQTIIKSNGLWD